MLRLALILALAPGWAGAEFSCEPLAGRVAAIHFQGNQTTARYTLRRELDFAAGHDIRPGQAEAGRQAIANLRLFKSVALDCTAGADGLILTYRVKEKFYFIPLPRLDANSDQEYAYGLQLRWFNVAGLNQTLDASFERANEQREGRGTRTDYSLNYRAPWLGRSLWGLRLDLEHRHEPVEAPGGTGRFLEQVQQATAIATRHFPGRSRSQGLTLGAGLSHQRQRTQGESAPPDFGQATALRLRGLYQDIRFVGYSETGVEWDWDLAAAGDATGSDYPFNRIRTTALLQQAVGSRPHQVLALRLEAGWFSDGPPDDERAFELGGSSSLRGHPNRSIQADGIVHLSLEYLHPTGFPGIRLLGQLEAGRGWRHKPDSPSRWLGSLGLGLRIRFTSFVRLQLDLGWAMPLSHSARRRQLRFFGSGS